MKPWTVTWQPSAQNELARLWNTYPNRRMLSLAANRIDNLLAKDPERQGVPLPGGFRHLFEYPLEIAFKVYPNDRRVKVFEVRHL